MTVFLIGMQVLRNICYSFVAVNVIETRFQIEKKAFSELKGWKE